MGQLTELGFATAEVNVAKGQVLTLRAIALDDVLRISRKHGEAFESLFAKITGAAGASSLDLESTNAVALSLLEAAPEIAAEVIAYAADDPAAVAVARRLPFPVQMECLEKIGTLTFSSEGGPKKLLETVIKMAQGATSLTKDLRTPLSGSTA